MSDHQLPDAEYLERSTPRVILRYRPGSYAAERIDALAERAERVARYVDRRLKPLRLSGRRWQAVTLTLEPELASNGRDRSLLDGADRVSLTPDAPSGLFAERVALVMLRERFGGSAFWTPLADTADAGPVLCALEFLALGLARYFASEAEGRTDRFLGAAARGGAPMESADRVVRQIAADRGGKVPLYECLMRGPTLATPPEYAALAESFCGYLFEREGPKAYRRFVQGARENPSAAADLRYGKTIEQLIDEWLSATLRGYSRQPVTVLGFGRDIIPYLRPYKWLMSVILVLIFLSSGVAQILPFQIRDITDLLVSEAAKRPSNQTLISDLWSMLTTGQPTAAELNATHAGGIDTLAKVYAKLLIAALAIFVQGVGLVWLVYLVNVVGQNILRDLRLKLTDRMHHLSSRFYARSRMGDLLVRFTSDIPRLADPLADIVAYSIYYLVFLVATTWAMLAMSWQLSIVLFFIVPAYIWSSRLLGPAIQVASRARQERLSQLNANLEEMLFGHAVVKGYGLSGHLMTRFRPKIQEYRKVAIWTDFLRAIFIQFVNTVDNVTTKLVWVVGAAFVVIQTMTLGTITGFGVLMGRFIRPLHALSTYYAQLSVAAASLRRIEEILREPMEVMDIPPGGRYAPDGVREGITFEHAAFSYTGVEPTIDDISLFVPAGSKVAFVGPTGAGKSTLVSLIPRFYDVDSGRILLDGEDIRSFSLAGLRQSISTVSQDTFLFNATILENIRLGRLDASDEEVIEAAKDARLHAFVETLPAGYDTLVGERGWRLSGGQKQRVAIARALLRNSPIMILDEATSALDAETEAEILAELDEVTVGKTVISITHRLGLAIKSDTICVLQAGRIIQQGSHEELIHQDGLYRKLFEDQNRELVRRASGEQLDDTLDRIQSVPTFSLVSTDEVFSAARPLRTERYPAGALCIAADDAANGHLYLLRSGQLEVTVQDGQNTEQHLTIVAPTNGSGEPTLSLLLSIPHSARARAVTAPVVVVLEGGALRHLIGDPLSGGRGPAFHPPTADPGLPTPA